MSHICKMGNRIQDFEYPTMNQQPNTLDNKTLIRLQLHKSAKNTTCAHKKTFLYRFITKTSHPRQPKDKNRSLNK